MKSLGLYLHVPFCRHKCHYCNFFSFCADNEEYDEYVEQMKRAVRKYGKIYSDRLVDTVYFGGGTPSVLGSERLSSILKEIKTSFQVKKNAEITFEANPTSADQLDFFKLKKEGFNRISFGLQSANEKELCLLGREHTPEDAYKVIIMAKEAGFENLSLDIMLALPYQTKDSLQKTIDFCASCDVKHISAYILKVEEGTILDRMKDRFPLYSDDEQAEFYEYAVNALEKQGYNQYEISNFSKVGFQSRHNLRYWHDDEYLGFGPSAHSYIDGKRFFYENSLCAFYQDQTLYESAGGDTDEYIMLRLRLNEGLSYSDYESRYHQKIDPKLIERAKILEKERIVTLDKDHLALTLKGFLVSNAVIGYLLNNT